MHVQEGRCHLASVVVASLQNDFGIGLVLGPSGAGKSTILRQFFGTPTPQPRWHSGQAVISHFRTPNEGVDVLLAVGLNTIPAWLRPYEALSTGERCRADLARRLACGSVVEDEFTSMLDRLTAVAVAVAISRYCRARGLRRVVFATCHEDVARFLQPDWVLWMPHGELLMNPCGEEPITRKGLFLRIDLSSAANNTRTTSEVNMSDAGNNRWGTAGSADEHAIKNATCIVKSRVRCDDHTTHVAEVMDIKFSGVSSAVVPSLDFGLRDALPRDFRIGLIIGPSGTGKTSLLKQFGAPAAPIWNQSINVIDHFDGLRDGKDRLRAAGLANASSWYRPYSTLSTGEQHRADLARALNQDVCIDEFTSTVDRDAAKLIATSIATLVRHRGWYGIVFAGCHFDIAKNLKADWIYDALARKLMLGPDLKHAPDHLNDVAAPAMPSRVSPQSHPDVAELYSPVTWNIRVERCGISAWSRFQTHHYLSSTLNRGSACYVAMLDADDKHLPNVDLYTAVGFVACIPLACAGKTLYGTPKGKGAYREHRLVIVPELQGLGLGRRLSEAIAQLYVDRGFRYTSKAAHPRVAYRAHSNLWRSAPNNGELILKDMAGRLLAHPRRCFNYEYVGNSACEGARSVAPKAVSSQKWPAVSVVRHKNMSESDGSKQKAKAVKARRSQRIAADKTLGLSTTVASNLANKKIPASRRSEARHAQNDSLFTAQLENRLHLGPTGASAMADDQDESDRNLHPNVGARKLIITVEDGDIGVQHGEVCTEAEDYADSDSITSVQLMCHPQLRPPAASADDIRASSGTTKSVEVRRVADGTWKRYPSQSVAARKTGLCEAILSKLVNRKLAWHGFEARCVQDEQGSARRFRNGVGRARGKDRSNMFIDRRRKRTEVGTTVREGISNDHARNPAIKSARMVQYADRSMVPVSSDDDGNDDDNDDGNDDDDDDDDKGATQDDRESAESDWTPGE